MVDRVVTDEKVALAVRQPPQTTRARLRGAFIKAAKAQQAGLHGGLGPSQAERPGTANRDVQGPVQGTRRAGGEADREPLSRRHRSIRLSALRFRLIRQAHAERRREGDQPPDLSPRLARPRSRPIEVRSDRGRIRGAERRGVPPHVRARQGVLLKRMGVPLELKATRQVGDRLRVHGRPGRVCDTEPRAHRAGAGRASRWRPGWSVSVAPMPVWRACSS